MFLNKILLCLNIAILLISCVTCKAAPNIVFVFADDFGWNDIGFHGSSQIRSPIMDSLAYNGIILNNYYLSPLCTPSRASLMVGRHAVRTGLQYHVVMPGQRLGLPLHFKTMPQYLNELGYESHAVGKWHLGNFHKNYTPTYRGFKTFYGFYGGHNDYFDHYTNEGGYPGDGSPDWWGLDWHYDVEGKMSDVWEDFGEYSTRAIARKASEIIHSYDFDKKPLFLYLPFQAIHSANVHTDPVQAPTETVYQFPNIWNIKRRKVVAAVKELDDAVGQVVGALLDKRVFDNTILIFSTDNGGAPNDFNSDFANNFPLRAGKGYYFEGGCRGAAFVYGNMFRKRAGEVSMDLMHVSDWLPTLYEAAGGNVKNLGDIESFSMYDLLTGKNLTNPRNEFLININDIKGSKGIRVGRYKYMLNPWDRWTAEHDNWFEAPGKLPDTNETLVPNTTPAQVWCGPIPYGTDFSCRSKTTGLNECIYDIEKDPCEFYNLVDDPEYQDVKKMLLKRLEYWDSLQAPEMDPPMWDEAGNPKNLGWVYKPWTDDPKIPPNSPIPN